MLLEIAAIVFGVIALTRFLLSGKMCPHRADLTGKVAIVTGSTCGMGKEAALALAGMGATVVIASRDKRKCFAMAAEVAYRTGNNRVEAIDVDLSDLRDVERFVGDFLELHDHVDILINNAAVMGVPLGGTKQGFETHMGVNYVSHFHLTRLLLPAIRRAHGRVVCYGSISHWMSAFYELDFADFLLATHPKRYSPHWLQTYSQTKLCMILFAQELHRRFGDEIRSFAVDPGAVGTEITRYGLPAIIHWIWTTLPMARPPIEGAQSAIYCAVAPEEELKSGGYYENCEPARLAAQARDEKLAVRLWDFTKKLIETTAPTHQQ